MRCITNDVKIRTTITKSFASLASGRITFAISFISSKDELFQFSYGVEHRKTCQSLVTSIYLIYSYFRYIFTFNKKSSSMLSPKLPGNMNEPL